tara:strand:+ start:744 stop:1217 length:474 start_codon:yes stop_codon:yes gene_type:complete
MIKIFCQEKLKKVLLDNNIENYTPAYEGESAGLDLYNSGDNISVMPSSTNLKGSMVSTGLHIFTPPGYVTLIKERGSITKTPLKYRAGVIDSGYTGEIFVNLVNIGNEEYIIKKGQKLPVQLIVVKCDNKYSEINEKEYLNLTQLSQRKDGKIGSSD